MNGTHPVTGVKTVICCDDFLVRGSAVESTMESTKFYSSLENKFDCRPGSRQVLTPDSPIEFTGIPPSVFACCIYRLCDNELYAVQG